MKTQYDANEVYHSSPGISASGLKTIHKKSHYHSKKTTRTNKNIHPSIKEIWGNVKKITTPWNRNCIYHGYTPYIKIIITKEYVADAQNIINILDNVFSISCMDVENKQKDTYTSDVLWLLSLY